MKCFTSKKYYTKGVISKKNLFCRKKKIDQV